AHAWAEVYFAGVGWQGFDPTASVPLAGEAPVTKSWLDSARGALPYVAVALLAGTGLVFAGSALVRRQRGRVRRNPSWAATMQARMLRLGRRAQIHERPDNTVREYARAVAVQVGEPHLADIGAAIDADAFSARGIDPADRRAVEDEFARIERDVRERTSRRARPRVVTSQS